MLITYLVFGYIAKEEGVTVEGKVNTVGVAPLLNSNMYSLSLPSVVALPILMSNETHSPNI
jgi:hypothetical protein